MNGIVVNNPVHGCLHLSAMAIMPIACLIMKARGFHL
jgi:hypothetical protein